MSKKKIKLRYLFLFFLIGFLFIHSFENSIFNNYNIKSEESNVLLKMIHTSSSINDFLSYKEITIDHTMVKGSNNLINFPLMISMLDSDLHNETQSDGDDIAFFEGINLLDYEIELFNQTYNNTHAYLVAWVRIPTLSCTADTKIYMYYGNTTMTSQENPSGVWDSNYKGVWHLSEDPTGMIIDSTSKNPYGTTYGEMSLGDSVNGRIAGSLNFDGIDDYVKVNYTTNLNITSALTLETWVKGRGNWWNSNYQYRKKLTINAPATNAIPQQYTMHLQFDHSSLVSAGKSRIDGNDIRLVYWNGLNWYELDRILDIDKPNSWNRNNTKNLFKIQNQIDAGEFDDNYYLYYGNSDAINAPTNEAYIWRYYNSLDSLPTLSYANTGGAPTWSVSSGRLKLTHDGSNAARAMISDSPSLTNFIAYVDIEMGSSSSGRAGLVWREQPSGAGYVSRIKIMSDFRLAIINDDSSYYSQIFQNSEVINSGTIYRLRTRAIGSNLTFGFKTISALSYLENSSFDSTYLNGQFGFWGEKVESNGQYWNDLRIKLVLSNEPSIPSQGSEEQCGIHKNNAFSLVLDKSKVAGFINNKVLFTSIDSAWNHLVLTYNGFIQKLYLNGELKEIKSHSGVINTNTNDFIIGNFFNGTIDEIRISNVERSADWIATEYNNFINRQAYEEPEETTTLWSPYVEWSIENSNYSGNPYDIVANVTFFHSNSGTIIKTQMFYDSNNTWKFRFTGTKIGIWSYTTSSNVPNLDGHSGSLKVNPNNNTNNKGFVTNFGNKWGWTGTNEVFVPQFVMYKTPITYFNQLDMIDTDIQTFIVEHGFTGFHTNVYCRWFNVSEDRYDNIDIPNPDQRTFEALELLITKTYNAGGVVHIWAWGDEQRHMTPIKWGINGIEDKRLQRYIAARLGPLPGWTMGYGFDLDEWVTEGELEIWRNYMHQHLGWAHFLGGRPEGPNSGIDHSPYISWNEKLDYSSYEHHKPSYDVYVAALNTIPQQPVFSEDRFRIRDTGYLKDYNMEETRRGLWHSTMAGGVANIWGHLLNSPDGGTASGPYPNPEWIKTNTEFFKNRFKENMVRDNAITNGVCLKAQDNKRYLFYKEDTDSIQINLSDMNGPQQVIAVDTKRVYLEIDLGILNSENQTLYFGNQSDWAIAIGDFNPPDSPSLIKPNNNTIINVNTPYLDWSNLTDISHYHIQISTNSAFSNIVRDIVLPFSEWIVSPALSDGEFYWKVRCNDSTGNWGTWSNFSVFIIDTISPNITLIIEQSKLFGNTPPVIFIDVDDLNLDSIWYLLYNGSLSTDNYTWTGEIEQYVWDQIGNGTVILRFYANDTAGNWVFAEDFVRKDINAPVIVINSPSTDDLFGANTPSYDLTVTDANFDSIWYSLDGGNTNSTPVAATGIIDQTMWDTQGNGTVTIRFYANDTMGNVNYKEVIVRKDIIKPSITINSPSPGSSHSTPPSYSLSITEANLDEIWYTLDGGLNNYTGALSGTINSIAWGNAGLGAVTITFHANDSAGNWDSANVGVTKTSDLSISINSPNTAEWFRSTPGYDVSVSGNDRDFIWYTLDNGLNNYTITSNANLSSTWFGVINSTAWGNAGQGSIIITFYLNDTFGITVSDTVQINKDTIDPSIIINSPNPNDLFGSSAPDYDLTVTDANFDSIWYSLDGGNTNSTAVSSTGNIDQIMWDAQGNGTVTIRFYANDTLGNINYEEVTVRKDINAPVIVINSPSTDDLFGANAPSYDLTVTEANLDSIWYSLDGGNTNSTAVSATGSINQIMWDAQENGTVMIKFYINNTLGVIWFDEIIVKKDTITPLISIILPLNNSYYSKPPIINLLASDGNLDSIWYSVETYNISLINNAEQELSYSIWSILPEGEFHIFLYANDTVGNINDIYKLTLHKDSIAPPPPNLLTYPQGKVDIPIIFDWEEGSDPSGISQYRLIVDNEIDPFSTPGFIFEIYINNTSPESSYYKFNQSLSPGTYYFHLFQFDGVDHESNSTSGSFIVIKSDITPPSIQWWIIVLAIVISSLIVAVSIKKIKNKVNKQKNLNKKDKIIKLFNKENGKPQAQQKIADISITYSCINDLLTKFFDDLGIKYYSNPQIYQDYQKIINGLILNENKLFHKFYGNLEIYQRLKAIQIIYTDDLSRENIIHQCQNFQHYDLGLIIVGIKWPRSQNIQTLDIPYDIGIKYRENIQVIHHELFAIKIGLEQNYKVAFNEIIDLYNQMDYEFLHKVHQSNTVRIHNTEELKQDLNRIGLINNDLNEFF